MKKNIVKTVKVSDKGQIALPLIIRDAAGIERGDELLIIECDGKILIEKTDQVAQTVTDDFKDIIKFSEQSLKSLWDNKEDDIWESYLNK